MILLYHKIDIITPSRWWVSVKKFAQQISSMRQRYEFVYLDQYELGNENQVVITFDDGYENVFNHAFPILRGDGIPFEMFVNSDLIGKWNYFDQDEMLTRFCSLGHLEEMSAHGGRLQWHTRGHLSLPGLGHKQLEFQVSIPTELRTRFPPPHFNWFAYPYGMHDRRCVDFVKSKFSGALSVDHGSDDDIYRLNRVTVDESWSPG